MGEAGGGERRKSAAGGGGKIAAAGQLPAQIPPAGTLEGPVGGVVAVACRERCHGYLELEGLDRDHLAGPPNDTLPQAAACSRRDNFDELEGLAIAAGR